jgi:hypothetical protein
MQVALKKPKFRILSSHDEYRVENRAADSSECLTNGLQVMSLDCEF